MVNSVTLADVLAEIKDEEFLFPRGKIVTICVLTLQNGRQVVGEVYGQNFDPVRGKAEAREAAIKKIWPLLVCHAHCKGD